MAAAPPVPAYDVAESEEGGETEDDGSQEPSPTEIEAMNVTFPETVALIQARNSVAAAWLWRKFAAGTQWNVNAIRITPLCGTVGEPD